MKVKIMPLSLNDCPNSELFENKTVWENLEK